MNAEDTSLGSDGITFGGALRAVGDTVSAPRRMLWNALFGTDRGDQLVSKVTGMDSESALAKALGFGAETLLDPVNLLMAAPLVKGAYSASRAVKPALNASTLARSAETANALQAADTIANQAALAEKQAALAERYLQGADLAGMAQGTRKTFAQASPEVIAAFEQANMGKGAGALKELAPGYNVGPLQTYGNPVARAGQEIGAGQSAVMRPMQVPVEGRGVIGKGFGPAIGPEGLPQLPPGAADQLLMAPMGAQPQQLAEILAQQAVPGRMSPEALARFTAENSARQSLLASQSRAAQEAAKRALARGGPMNAFDWSMVGSGALGGAGLGAALGTGAI